MHAIDRAKERYGVNLGVDDIKTLENRVRTGDVKILKQDALGLVCEADVLGIPMRFVYVIASGHVSTFKPYDWSKPEPDYDEWRRDKMRKKGHRFGGKYCIRRP